MTRRCGSLGMRGLPLAALAVFCLAVLTPLVQAAAWTPSTYPNPMRQPELCRSQRVGVVCDPDAFVPASDIGMIEDLLEKIKRDDLDPCTGNRDGYEVAFAVMGYMSTTFMPGADDETRAGRFAAELMDAWGVGDRRCNNGVVLLLSVYDRQVFIYGGVGAQSALTDREKDVVIEKMRPILRAQRYGEALLVAADWIDRGLTGNIGPWIPEEVIIALVLVGFVAVFGGIIYCANRAARRRARDYNRVERLLQRMERGEDLARQGAYFASSCPICLEDFSPDHSPVPGSDDPEPSAPPPPPGDAGAPGTSSGEGAVRYPDITPSESEPLLGQDGARPNARESARLRSNGSRGASAGQAQVDSAADDPDAGLPPIDRRGPEHGPVYLPCGHAFCGECISRHLRQGPAGRPSCPICRATFDDDMQPRRDPPRQADPRRAPPGSRFGRGYYSDRCYMGMDYDMYDMEYRYRMGRMRHRYPIWIPATVPVVPPYGAVPAQLPRQSAADILNAVRAAERARVEAQSRGSGGSGGSRGGFSGGSFGGGSSRGGGGRGGSW